jgi:chemotaxis protein methyltransferase CheR
MIQDLTRQEFVLLRDFIYHQIGISLKDDKMYLVENRLHDLVKEAGCKTYGEFYLKLKHTSMASDLRIKLVDAISTNETSWFRDKHPFEILKALLLPRFHEKKSTGRTRLNIWSAACSTGQEPYSIAMTILDFGRTIGFETDYSKNTHIFATDISSTALAFARMGEYDALAMKRGINENHTSQYFTKTRNQWKIRDNVKNMVLFSDINLKEPFYPAMGPFDIIFLRNVIIYFSDELRKSLFNRLIRLLAPGGYLFLGTGETVSGYTDKFDIREHKGAIYYQLKY